MLTRAARAIRCGSTRSSSRAELVGPRRGPTASAWRCRTTGTRRSSAAPTTTGARGRCGCSPARGEPGPSRARSSSAPAPSATPTRAPAWRFLTRVTPRSSAARATTATQARCGCSRARGRPGPSRARSSSAPGPSATPSRAPAWRCQATGTRRSSAAPSAGGEGAVWVFTRSGRTWTQQGPKLVGTGALGDAVQGTSVALSGDGNTALVGGPGDNLSNTPAVPGGGVGVHALGDDLDPAGPKARRHRRRRPRRPGHERGAVGRR